MRQLLPSSSPQETCRYNVVHFLLRLNHSVKLSLLPLLISTILKLTLDISIKHLHPLNQRLQVHIRGLGMLQQESRIIELIDLRIATVERHEYCRSEIVGPALLIVEVGLECVDRLLHDEWNVEQRLGLRLCVEDVEDVVEGWVQLQVVELGFGVRGFGLLDQSHWLWFLWGFLAWTVCVIFCLNFLQVTLLPLNELVVLVLF